MPGVACSRPIDVKSCGRTISQVRSIASHDPDVRTFMTACSMNHAASYGDCSPAGKAFPLLIRIGGLAGQRAMARNGEWERFSQKRIDRFAIPVRSQDDDLHRRVAYDLVQAFEVIVLPSVATRDMDVREVRLARQDDWIAASAE